MERTNTDGPTPWDELPDLLKLSEVVQITRQTMPGAYYQLQRAIFPIAYHPGPGHYRFPKAKVRAWVEDGVISNESLKRSMRRRGPGRKHAATRAAAGVRQQDGI
jgi:predicted DNA-binding transcriptional regulator AlpA